MTPLSLIPFKFLRDQLAFVNSIDILQDVIAKVFEGFFLLQLLRGPLHD